MLVESSRVLGALPQFCKVLSVRIIGSSKFFSTSLNEKIAEPNQNSNLQNKTNAIENADSVENEKAFQKFRFKYPEFLPFLKYRNPLKEKLERRDMLRRRQFLVIPEFYVGSILAVTTADKHAVGKTSRFVGICIFKEDNGLFSQFILRNIVDHQGVEVMYSLYSPVIHKIEVLKLEKRLDEELFYLRDCPHEYSTIPFDMQPIFHDEKQPVPVNEIKVPLNPRPWLQRYERMELKGVILPEIPEKCVKSAKKRIEERSWEKYDLMDQYRRVVTEEDQRSIFAEICEDLKELEIKRKTERKKKVFVKTTKQKIF